MDPDEIDPEIAQAMGFTSFGGPSKRRKYNHDDAYVSGQEGNKTNNNSKKSGSGANTTALGVRARVATQASGSVGVTRAEGGEVKGEPQGIEERAGQKESDKAKAKKGKALGLADYVAWGNSVAAQSTTAAPLVEAQDAPTTEEPAAEATKAVEAVELGGGDGAHSWPQGWPNHEELGQLRRGVRNGRGDVAYFMPSFVEDPWKELVG